MIIHGDCLEEMSKMEANSISAIITDPPYGLKFMGKQWDHGVPGEEFWSEALRICKPRSWMLAFGGTRTYHRLTCAIEDAGWEIRDCIMWIYGQGFPKGKGCLKPSYEPIILARKRSKNPELNIEECRIKCDDLKPYCGRLHVGLYNDDSWEGIEREKRLPSGRWPANIILDEESAQMLDDQTGILKSGGGIKNSGGASRFFYCAKASPSERNGSKHPTMKPIKLMEYLMKLIMVDKNGTILDPFCGSGTTLLAAKNLGISAIGIEKEEEYCKIANARNV
jgi:site-specific DNA-methyltransferase (adenine-specific)